MADKKTSEETAGAALDGTELIRIVQSGANVKETAQQFKDFSVQPIPLTTDEAQAFDIGNDGIDGQTYIIDNSGATQLPSSIDLVRINCITGNTGVKQWNPNVQVHLTSADIWIDATYDVAGNTVFGWQETKILITQSSTDTPTITEFGGSTMGAPLDAAGYISVGVYTIGFHSDIGLDPATTIVTFGNTKRKTAIYASITGTNEIKIEAYDISGLTPIEADDMLNNTPFIIQKIVQ